MNNYKELVSALCEKESRDNRELLDAAADAIEQLCTDVERLEAENRAKEQYIAETIGKVIRERDAAIADLTLVGSCVICKHQDYFYHGVRCGDVKCRFEWRGVQEVIG